MWVKLYSWHYSQTSMFIQGLFIECDVHSIDITDIIDNVHNIPLGEELGLEKTSEW